MFCHAAEFWFNFFSSQSSLIRGAPFLFRRRISSLAMTNRSNYQRGGGYSRSGAPNRGGRGCGRGGREQQRWWDPVWRAERLRQNEAELEVLNKDDLLNQMKQLKNSGEQEMIIRKNHSRSDQQIMANIAFQHNLYFHAYNKGKTLVVSKIPLPDYRADLDERHGSIQKEIQMSKEIEKKVGDLLDCSSRGTLANHYGSASTHGVKYLLDGLETSKSLTFSVTNGVDKEISAELKQRQHKLMASPNAKELQRFREKLPAFKMKAQFMEAIMENQVLVVSGETGCGKTTQLPQFILEEEISCMRGACCRIICTQPRRISAISVATRVSSERGESVGGTVGYQIRLEAKRSAQTRLLFCTTGVLLRQLVQDPDLTGVSHLLVDEIHERGMQEDFLLIILHDLLPRRPNLRLILMSATINADLFSKYFGNAPTIHILGLSFPVKEMFLEDVLDKTGYCVQLDSNDFKGHSRRARRRDQALKKDPLMEMFEGIDIDLQYKNYSASTRRSLEAWSGTKLDLGLVEAAIEYVCCNESDGAILVFLTGWDEISNLIDKIKKNKILGDPNKFMLLPLHGLMPTINQREIFERPPPFKRKIVIATNIAESSITIDDVVYVIDCGKAKETSYDALNKLACLLPSWISKASAHQRRGRAGRVQPGVCYRLYPKVIHEAMAQYQLPEILRTPLEELCLQIKSLQLGIAGTFLAKALQPPDPLSVQNAIELLRTIGALDDVEELTPLGRHLCTVPANPSIGKMLLMGCVFQCLNPALTIAAALAHRDPFLLPMDKKDEASAARRSFAADSCSDHIALVNAFEGYRDAKQNHHERSFCWDNYLSLSTLQLMEDLRAQFLDLLSDIGFVDKSKGPNAYNQYGHDLEMVSAILCAGLFPNVVQCKRRGRRTAFYTKEVGKVDIHPGSVNAGVSSFPLPYMIYSEKVKTTSIFVRDSTNISDFALLLFGGNLVPGQTMETIEMLDGYLHFSASKSVLDLIKKLRAELDQLLQRKLEDPGMEISVEGKGVVSAAVELLHSFNFHH